MKINTFISLSLSKKKRQYNQIFETIKIDKTQLNDRSIISLSNIPDIYVCIFTLDFRLDRGLVNNYT